MKFIISLCRLSITLLICIQTLTACGPEPKAPSLQNTSIEVKESVVKIGDWGPKETVEGKGVNIQPDGISAIWISASGISRDPGTRVTFGTLSGLGVVVSENLVTVGVPKDVISIPGIYDVQIIEPNGRVTHVGAFTTKGNKK